MSAADIPTPAAVQTIWADVIVAALGAAGVDLIVLSPGSRSTPLAAALARAAAPVEVVVDERAAAFFALGRARVTGRPCALVCTSGTAPAHYLPAVIEASHAGVPLVVVSADRPPELQGAGAPQTIDQTRLFGEFARAFVELGAPEASALALRAARRKIAQAVAAARGPRPGPVQINAPLRKPLEPAAPATDADRALAAAAAALAAAPLVAPPPTLRAADDAIEALAAALAAAARPLIVCGPAPLGRAAARDALHAIARAAGAVILAEATSQLRFGPRPAAVVACDAFDLVLAAPRRAAALAPDLIVQLGGEPTAQAWAPFAARSGAPRWVVADHAWPDAESSAQGLVVGDVADALARIAARLEAPAAPPDAHASAARAAWTAAWRAADADAARVVAQLLAAAAPAAAAPAAAAHAPALAEPAAIRAAVAAAPPAAQLVVGNSLPVRAVDHVCPGSGHARPVLAQRGANGIDGLVAGAAGAASTGRPTLLVLGDVSLAHDAGALAVARAARAPLAIVVIDNGGGRIFDQLPVAAALPAEMDRLWRTPTGLDPVALAAAFGCRAVRADDAAALAAAVAAALERPGATLVHAPVAPDSALTFRRAAIAALDATAADAP